MNWPALIAQLLRVRNPDGSARWTCASIARQVGCTRQRIAQLRQVGTEPSWSVGQRLIALHLQMSNKFDSD